MHILEKLFGSRNRVKIMRFFLFHPNDSFSNKEIYLRIGAKESDSAKEINFLESIGFLKKGIFKEKGRRREKIFHLNERFYLVSGFRKILLKDTLIDGREIKDRISCSGNIKLLILSGIWLEGVGDGSGVDLFVVGDNFKETNFRRIVRGLEQEIGKELHYCFFTTKEFKYRLDMYDKLVRDVLDFPHVLVVDKLNIS